MEKFYASVYAMDTIMNIIRDERRKYLDQYKEYKSRSEDDLASLAYEDVCVLGSIMSKLYHSWKKRG